MWLLHCRLQWGGLYDIWELLKKLFTFYFLCLKIRRRRLDIQITTLLERRCLCMFFFGVFYPFLPMLLVGKSMFYTWSSSKISFHPCFNLVILGLQCFFISPPCSFFTLSQNKIIFKNSDYELLASHADLVPGGLLLCRATYAPWH